MDHYLRASETLLLLSVSWGGPFILALLPQAKLIGRSHRGVFRAVRLIAVVVAEIVLALAILIATPVWRLPFLDLPGGLEILRPPLIAGIVAAVAITLCLWFLYRARNRHHYRGEVEAK